jgi:hypothetical protein
MMRKDRRADAWRSFFYSGFLRKVFDQGRTSLANSALPLKASFAKA